jgi:hypothetical protein
LQIGCIGWPLGAKLKLSIANVTQQGGKQGENKSLAAANQAAMQSSATGGQ